MVGWSKKSREAVARAAVSVARAKVCIDGGCKCYCHAPKNHHVEPPMWFVIFTIGAVLFVMLLGIKSCQDEQAAHPPMPYYCTGITSTGAPDDCHPAVLSSEQLKKYEDHFKQ